MNDQKAAQYVESVAHSAEPALTDEELRALDSVADHLRESDEHSNARHVTRRDRARAKVRRLVESYSGIPFTGGSDA